MIFEREILKVLSEAPREGMPLRRIALNVYNMSNTLFNPLDRDEVYADVGEWLRKTAAVKGASVEKAETRGWYKINLKSQKVQQMMLEFHTHEDDEWML